MRLDWLEAAIVFFVGLFNVITQSGTQILVLAPELNIFRAQHSDILHGNFGHAESAPVQFLLFRRQRVEIKNGPRFHCLRRPARVSRHILRQRLYGKIQFKIRLRVQ